MISNALQYKCKGNVGKPELHQRCFESDSSQVKKQTNNKITVKIPQWNIYCKSKTISGLI